MGEHGVARVVDVAKADAQWDRGAFSLGTGRYLGMAAQDRAIKAAKPAPSVIYYPIQNRVLMKEWRAWWNAHDFDKMEKELLGTSVSDRQ
jgi:hypothetical protein